jgi:hypothetical protein
MTATATGQPSLRDEIGRAQGTDYFALDALLTSEERALATRRSLRRSPASSSI